MRESIVKSPLINEGKAYLKDVILVNSLISDYKKKLNVDVSQYFGEKEEIYLYQCVETKYEFYYPAGIEGDSSFYQKLEKFDWYYMPWKWEHDATKKLLQGGERILEIGSGGLGFVEKIKECGFDITGLELNENSVSEGRIGI